MRKGGIIIISATPISGSAHLYDMFATGEVDVQVSLREGEEPITIKRKVFHMTADVESACMEHGIRGHLEHEHIVQMIAEYPEDERQARIYGKFQHLVGLVFKRFNKNVHVIKPFAINPKDFVVLHMLDPHPRNNDAGMWVAIDRKGTKYIVDEYWFKPEDVKQMAWHIKKKNAEYRVVGMYGDPSMFIEDQHTQRSLNTMMVEEGLAYIPASKTRQASDARIATALNYTEINGHMVRAPELYIFDTCKRTIFEFEHYRWDEWKGSTAEGRDRKERPLDKDDHMIENLGRALIMEQPFIEMPKPRETEGVVHNTDLDPYD